MVFQQRPDDHQQCRHQIWVRPLLLFLLIAILLWALSTMNIVQGTWATMLNAVFTGLGTVFALLQWHTQTVSENPCPAPLSPSGKGKLHEQFAQDLTSKRKGAIVVYASRKWRGTTLHLVSGLQETPRPIHDVHDSSCTVFREEIVKLPIIVISTDNRRSNLFSEISSHIDTTEVFSVCL